MPLGWKTSATGRRNQKRTTGFVKQLSKRKKKKITL
jgi:hypothetical protein